MAINAVVLIGDESYIYPSVASAISARKNLTRNDVDVILCVVLDDRSTSISALQDRLAPHRVIVKGVQIDELRQMAELHIDHAVPPSGLSRLWIHRMLDADTRVFLYLDGDTLVDDRLDPLFDMAIPPGGLLAAEDCVCLYNHEIRQPHAYWKPYFESIGVEWSNYFNSGVMLVDRSGWESLSSEALRYLRDHSELCRSSDQTALNVVAGDRRGRLPLRWNYQTEHMMILDPRTANVQPAIWHFSGGPKPWDMAAWPWDESFNREYRAAEQLLDGLDIQKPTTNLIMFEEGVRHRQRQQRLQRWRFLYRRHSREHKIKAVL